VILAVGIVWFGIVGEKVEGILRFGDIKKVG
jgi:hypothetical protein